MHEVLSKLSVGFESEGLICSARNTAVLVTGCTLMALQTTVEKYSVYCCDYLHAFIFCAIFSDKYEYIVSGFASKSTALGA